MTSSLSSTESPYDRLLLEDQRGEDQNFMNDFWSSIPSAQDLRGEGEVELRLVVPLLYELGYEAHDIASKYPVMFQKGKTGHPHEADIVCFYGPLHNKDTSLLVVEAKRPGEG